MSRDTRIVASFLAAIAASILAAAVICAWAGSPFWVIAFRVLCHGIPRRCFEIAGTPMPICTRCTGIYAGMLVAILLFAVVPAVKERLFRAVAIVAAIPILIDGLTQAAGLRESTNALRLTTGSAAAFAFIWWVLSAVENGSRQRATSP